MKESYNYEQQAVKWAQLVIQTRAYGHCYVPAQLREDRANYSLDKSGKMYEYKWTAYGRSLQGGGHKHKAYAVYVCSNGKPVPTKMLAR